MFPKVGRMVLVLPAWRGFQQSVRKHRVHWPTLASGRESKQAPSGACETLHPAGECILEGLNPSLSQVELVKLFTFHFSYIFWSPNGFESLWRNVERLKLSTQLANAVSFQWVRILFHVKLSIDAAGNCNFELVYSNFNFKFWISRSPRVKYFL